MYSFKKCVVALSINLALFSSAFACTTLLVGSEASADGSMMVARSADSDALKAQHFVIHPAKQGQSGMHSSKAHNGANDFSYPLPKNSLRYTTVPKLEDPAAWRHRVQREGSRGERHRVHFCLTRSARL